MKYLLHRKWLLMIMSLLAVSFVALQFIRPNFNNPAVTSDIVAPVAVKKILINACYDCHSNLTRASWFEKIIPAIWIVVNDIRDGGKWLISLNGISCPWTDKANIPWEIHSVEKINLDGTGKPTSEKYGGNPQKEIVVKPSDVKQRLHFALIKPC